MSRPRVSPGRLLRDHFFEGLLHNDLISPHGHTERSLVQVASVAAVPGLVFSYVAVKRYVVAFASLPAGVREAAVTRDRALLVAFSMLATAFVAVLQWDRLRLDARDLRVLGPLPIRRRTLATAKASAVLQFLGLFVLAVNLFTWAVFPLLSPPPGAGAAVAVSHLLAHATAIAGGSALVAFLATALAGAARWRGVQALGLVLLVQALFFLPVFATAMATEDGWRPLLLLPPAWFVGLYATLAGDPLPFGRELALAALAALVASGALLVALCARGAAEAALSPRGGPRAGGARRGAIARAVDWSLPGCPATRAVFWFVLHTLARSAPHRLRLSAWCGSGVALSGAPLLLYAAGADAQAASWGGAWMRASVVTMLFVLVGLRSAFAVPAALLANVVFRTSAQRDAPACHAGTRRAVTVLALAPIVAVLPPLANAFGVATALAHLGFGTAWAVLSVELLFGRLPSIPFTCAYVPEQANLRVHWASYVLGALLYLSVASAVEQQMLRGPGSFAIGLACLAALVATVRLRHGPARELEFEPAPAMAANPLGLIG